MSVKKKHTKFKLTPMNSLDPACTLDMRWATRTMLAAHLLRDADIEILFDEMLHQVVLEHQQELPSVFFVERVRHRANRLLMSFWQQNEVS